MIQEIQAHLKSLEREVQITVLFAAESGSRAWGFASPDSDWDVRFIYVRPPLQYLNLEPQRDTIDKFLPNDIDLAGWDLPKALFLFRKSNPSLYEWLASPLIYAQNDQFIAELTTLIPEYQSLAAGMYHYRSMAKTNYHKFLTGQIVNYKKYLYCLRPILACQFIERNQIWPPMPFDDLVQNANLPPEINRAIQELLIIKTTSNEFQNVPVNQTLHSYVTNELDRLMALTIDQHQNPDPQPLLDLLRSTAARIQT
jgi:uncharacterized protein